MYDVNELRQANNNLLAGGINFEDVLPGAAVEIERLRDENERLRAALAEVQEPRVIVKPNTEGWESTDTPEGGFWFLVDWDAFEKLLHTNRAHTSEHRTVGTHERIKQIVVSADGISVFTERRDA